MDEQALVADLFGLIRDLYGKKQADELIASFEGVFKAHENHDERLSILEYWHDFYRLRKYRRTMRRRRPTYQERMTACSACGYPASHRHHLWDVAMHGENKVTIQLCANCHELYHLLYNALVRDSVYSQKLVQHILFSFRVAPDTVVRVLEWCRATVRYEAHNGWTELWRASDEWVNDRLRWHDYQTQQSVGKT